jgi:hypothetical protein
MLPMLSVVRDSKFAALEELCCPRRRGVEKTCGE